MPAIIRRLPDITIGGGTSDFALAAIVESAAETSIAIAQSTFTVYGAAFSSGSSEPTAAEIEAGTGAIATASGSAIASLNFTDLSASTEYDFYVVGKDANGEYTSITKITSSTTGGGIATINPGIFIGAGII